MISLLAVFTLSPPLSVCHREILQVVMKVKTGHLNVGGEEREKGGDRRGEVREPLDAQPASLCCVVLCLVCVCVHVRMDPLCLALCLYPSGSPLVG